MDRTDKKHLKEKGKRGFIKEEREDIREARKAKDKKHEKKAAKKKAHKK